MTKTNMLRIKSAIWRHFSAIQMSHMIQTQYNRQSPAWLESGESHRKIVTIGWKGSCLAQYFLECTQLIFLDYLEKWKVVTGKYSAVLLIHLNVEIKTKKKRLYIVYGKEKKVLFHQLIAPAQTFVKANWMNCPTHRSLQIWLPVTYLFSYFKEERFTSNEDFKCKTDPLEFWSL